MTFAEALVYGPAFHWGGKSHGYECVMRLGEREKQGEPYHGKLPGGEHAPKNPLREAAEDKLLAEFLAFGGNFVLHDEKKP